MANIQIHELNSHAGALSSSDYLATDNGVNTTKIAVTDVTDILTPSISEMAVLVVTVPSFSSLPLTISNADITSDMVVVNSELGTPSAQTGDWTVTTSAGSLTVSGSISGSTTLKLYLMKSR